MRDLAQIAINATLSCDWEKAISTNKEILLQKSDDINALSRLAYAYIQIGKTGKAKSLYRKILSIDPYNIIAQKNIEKINCLKKRGKNQAGSKNKTNALSPNLFIEEPGKTKAVILTNIAPASVLSNIYIGDPVILCSKKHSIEVRNSHKIYLGALPDDIAFRLLRLMRGGNAYEAHIKNVTKNNITIFIREIKRGKRFLSQPSFTTSLGR